MPGITDSESGTPPIVPRVRRLLPALFLLAGVGLVPWTVYLVVTLPSRHVQTGFYDLAWGGFDVALAALLVATGAGLVRRRLWAGQTATAAMTLLLCDAWFDVLSSTPHERPVAVAMAVLAELPSAFACFLVARHVEEAAERAQRYALAARRLRPRRRRAAASDEQAGGVAHDAQLDLVELAE